MLIVVHHIIHRKENIVVNENFILKQYGEICTYFHFIHKIKVDENTSDTK